VRVFVTGASGFVGRWWIPELLSAGHEPLAAPGSSSLDVTDESALATHIELVRPDAVIHLAGVSFGPDARRDPDRAVAVNVGGTEALIAAIVATGRLMPLLIAGSSEVYGRPDPSDLPLNEGAPTNPEQAYGRTKLAQERIAFAAAERYRLPVVVTRSFNHTGPGQRAEFVAPALARRVLEARTTGASAISVGNIDVRRDIGDVRDVVRAYRLLIEALAVGTIEPGTVLNVATGRAIAIRQVLATLCEIAGVTAEPVVDPTLVRADDPPEIRGDASRLRDATGWQPTIDLERTLRDLVESIESETIPASS
jgi:GDP-4-dehydro-6-deoxy-D-mannose reductase